MVGGPIPAARAYRQYRQMGVGDGAAGVVRATTRKLAPGRGGRLTAQMRQLADQIADLGRLCGGLGPPL
jgi:hypothetical protein